MTDERVPEFMWCQRSDTLYLTIKLADATQAQLEAAATKRPLSLLPAGQLPAGQQKFSYVIAPLIASRRISYGHYLLRAGQALSARPDLFAKSWLALTVAGAPRRRAHGVSRLRDRAAGAIDICARWSGSRDLAPVFKP